MTMSEWVEIGRVEDIPLRGARVLKTEGGDIAVFRSGDDRIFALDDRCPHRDGSLSQGIVHSWKITCPLHNWAIELANGKAVPPDEGCATKYPVRIKDGGFSLQLATSLITQRHLKMVSA